MKKTLIASGCSFTNENFTSDFHHDMDCSWPKWPELLAKKLDMDFINLGHSGAGNEYIYTSLLDEIIKIDLNDIGLVMPAWSQAQRKDIKIRNKWKHLDGFRDIMIYSEKNYDPMKQILGDINYRIEQSLLLYYSLQEICKSRKIPLYQFQMIPLYDNDTKKREILKSLYNNSYYNEIDNNFLGWPTNKFLGGYNIRKYVLKGDNNDEKLKYQISKLDVHPNANGQNKITEFLYEQINR
jgi:hypothetical protein